jgi:hypothetical protein
MCPVAHPLHPCTGLLLTPTSPSPHTHPLTHSPPPTPPQYVRFGGPALRLGLLLEDADAFAADVAARHAGGLRGRSVMTAAMEALDLYGGLGGLGGLMGGLSRGREEGEEREIGSQDQQQYRRAQQSSNGHASQGGVLVEVGGQGAGGGGGGWPGALFPLSFHHDLRMAGQVGGVGGGVWGEGGLLPGVVQSHC